MNKDKKSTKLDLAVFEKNGKPEFAHIIKRNRYKATKALNGFLIGLKNEASGSKETSRIIVKFISNNKISKEEEKHLKNQVYDIFKILGIGVPFMLIPGSNILIPNIVKIAAKKCTEIIPSNIIKNKELNNSKMD